MDRFRLDVLQAWRALVRRPSFALTTTATLALVLGANAAIFAVASATLIRPLPVRDSGRAVQVFRLPPGVTDINRRNPLQQMDFVRVRERTRALSAVEGYRPLERAILENGEPAVVRTSTVTGGLFDLMAAAPARGRLIGPGDEREARAVAVLSHGYWQRAFGGREVLGTTLTIDGVAYEVIGILDRSFAPPFLDAEVFIPLTPSPEPAMANPLRSVVTVAELGDGVTLTQAEEDVQAVMAQLGVEFPRSNQGWRGGVQPVREWQYGATRAPVLVLTGAALVVLLIACVNIAGLTAAQAAERSGDLSLRLALGATRADVVRPLVAELFIVSVVGSVGGLLLAAAAVPALLALDPVTARLLGPITIDWRVQLFTGTLAIVAAFAAALLPALNAPRSAPASQLADANRRATGSRQARRVGRALVAGETALSVALLMAGAGLLQGVRDAGAVAPGFDPTQVLTAQVRLPQAAYDTTEKRADAAARMLAEVRALPGVVEAATSINDFTPGFAYQTLFHIEHRPTPDGQAHTTLFNRISSGYFDVMRIPVLAGRTFTDADTLDAPPVAIVSRLLADQLFPGEDPIGRTIRRTAANAPSMTIVGIVGDVRDVNLTQAPEATIYFPWAQNSTNAVPLTFVMRTEGDPLALASAARAAVQRVDPSLPLRRVQRLETFLDDAVAPIRFRATVLAIVAVLGLTLAALGIYGVAHRGVIERSREFAVRLALGATPGGIARDVAGDALGAVAVGATSGLIAGFVVSSVLASLVEHLNAADAATAAAAAGLLAGAAIVATLLPASRLLRLDAADVLRR